MRIALLFLLFQICLFGLWSQAQPNYFKAEDFYYNQGDLVAAKAALEVSFSTGEYSDLPLFQLRSQILYAQIMTSQGDTTAAITRYQNVINHYEHFPDSVKSWTINEYVHAHHCLGKLYLRGNDYNEALNYFLGAYRIGFHSASEIDNFYSEREINWALVYLYDLKNNFDSAFFFLAQIQQSDDGPLTKEEVFLKNVSQTVHGVHGFYWPHYKIYGNADSIGSYVMMVNYARSDSSKGVFVVANEARINSYPELLIYESQGNYPVNLPYTIDGIAKSESLRYAAVLWHTEGANYVDIIDITRLFEDHTYFIEKQICFYPGYAINFYLNEKGLYFQTDMNVLALNKRERLTNQDKLANEGLSYFCYEFKNRKFVRSDGSYNLFIP